MRELRLTFSALGSPALWAALFVSLLAATAAYQTPFSYTLDVGTAQATPYLINFYPQQPIAGRAARWSHAYSYIRFPGVGGDRPLRVTLDFNPLREGVQNPPPVHVIAFVGGEQLYDRTFQPGAGWQNMSLDVDASHPAAFASRDLVIELRTDVYRPPDYQGNELGIAVSRIGVQPLPGAQWQPVVPTVRSMLLLAVLVLLVYLLVFRSLVLANSYRTLEAGSGGKPLLARLFPAFVALLAGALAALLILLDPVSYSLSIEVVVSILIVAYALLLAAIYLLPGVIWPFLLVEGRAIRVALNYRPLVGLVIVAPILFSLAFQTPVSYSIDIGQGPGGDEAFIQGFNPPQFPLPDGSPGNYRATSAHASITIPGAGSDDAFSVTLRLNPGAFANPTVTIIANNSVSKRATLSAGWQDVAMQVNTGPAQLLEQANLDLEILSPAQLVEGGAQQGVLVDRVYIRQIGDAGPFSRSPAHEAGLFIALILLYLLIVRSAGLFPSLAVRRLALTAAAATLAVLTWVLITQRVETLVALPQLLTTLLSAYLLLVLASRLFPRLLRPLNPAHASHIARYLSLFFVLAFALRFGFSALPQMMVVDLPYHLRWLTTLLNGDFLALYLPGELSSVPPEWNLNVLIPKSPLFYMALWPLGLFKDAALGPTVLFIVSLIDAAIVPVLYALVRRVNERAALWSALLYAIMPLAFRAFAFGIFPTIFAQALTMPAFLMAVLWPDRLRRPLWFGGWALLLAASLIAFPTILAFNTFMVIFLAVAWEIAVAAPRRTLFLMLAGLGLAVGLSFVSYYGLYVQPFLAQTLPALSRGVSMNGRPLWPGGLPELIGWTGDYTISWVLWLLLPIAIALLGIKDRGPGSRKLLTPPISRRLSLLLLAWLIVLVGGVALNARFDMIGKHLYYTMPAAAIAGGLILSRLWSLRPACGYSRWLVVLAAMSVAWLALAFMSGRL